jgi:hypothetical protein
MGGQENKKVIVPKLMSHQTIYHKVNRKVKHVSPIVCVSAVGETLIPYMVTSQDSMRLPEALKKGVRNSGQTEF